MCSATGAGASSLFLSLCGRCVVLRVDVVFVDVCVNVVWTLCLWCGVCGVVCGVDGRGVGVGGCGWVWVGGGVGSGEGRGRGRDKEKRVSTCTEDSAPTIPR